MTDSGKYVPNVGERHCRFKVGDWEKWRGQDCMCIERVLRITEPQLGNYVLWTTLDGKTRFGRIPADFPINSKSVQRAGRRDERV